MNNIIPILFIIFNRPSIAARSFEEIKKVKPSRLYLASDGPRDNKPGEREIVENTGQTILNMIDWECEVKTLFRDKNVGCSQGVYTAVNWLFENEEMGIILEDDCVISETFYQFMLELLERYKDDTRIGMIAGTNPVLHIPSHPYSYFFSRYKSCWGWATWCRAWLNMDIDMEWRSVDKDSILYNSGYGGNDTDYWNFELKYIDEGLVSAWDWQWYFSLAAQNQLCIYPKNNLVTNIGNEVGATHLRFTDDVYKSYNIVFPLSHPKYIVPYLPYEKAYYKSFNTIGRKIARRLPFKIKELIKQIVVKCKL